MLRYMEEPINAKTKPFSGKRQKLHAERTKEKGYEYRNTK